MSSREKKSWEWGRKQRESGRALRGSSVARKMIWRTVSGVATGRERYIGGAVLHYDLIALSLDQE